MHVHRDVTGSWVMLEILVGRDMVDVFLREGEDGGRLRCEI